jgi:hypothetical protein
MTKQERTGRQRKSKSRELRYFSLRCSLEESIRELEGMGDLSRTNCTQNYLSEREKIAKKKSSVSKPLFVNGAKVREEVR